MSDNELGTFLRLRREAVKPSDVGLPEGTRRRTPGLRRSELSTLAGISVEYLTRLEQGRDRHPSAQVLAALADALRLGTDDRVHLRHLAKASSGGLGALCPGALTPPSRSVRPSVRMLLERLEPAPAVLLNRLGDVLAYTTGYERLARPIGLLDAERPNLLLFTFTDSRARAAYRDWERIADELVIDLRYRSDCTDPHVTGFVEELMILGGPPFSDRLALPVEPPKPLAVERLDHPEVGELRLTREFLELTETDAQRLVVHLPADDATSTALDHLTGRQPGALRVVNA
ncbi:helix-turn-helix domain-containing protein [Spirillospora sp. NPDC048911]|uniref:helix-turn-helix domain-containing protein n=1 Tax=Spirillospora sp. NPDC048911 TaxID=3364527 RepID=UPI00371B835D